MKKIFLICFLAAICYTGCQIGTSKKPKQELLLYTSGATKAPIVKLAKLFEHKTDCKIFIISGGSGNLYESILINQTGDLFLPGSDIYIDKLRDKNMIEHSILFAWNQPAIMTRKNSPLANKATLKDLLAPANSVIIGNPLSSSIGYETKDIMRQKKFYGRLINNIAGFAIDAHDLMDALKTNRADITINWQAMASWPQYRDFVHAITLKNIPKIKIELAVLKTSKNIKLALQFQNFVTSKQGKNIFKNHGFDITYDKNSTAL